MSTGWFRESHRHSLAARGIKTRYNSHKYFDNDWTSQERLETLSGKWEPRSKQLPPKAKPTYLPLPNSRQVIDKPLGEFGSYEGKLNEIERELNGGTRERVLSLVNKFKEDIEYEESVLKLRNAKGNSFLNSAEAKKQIEYRNEMGGRLAALLKSYGWSVE
jgi:hypothetical protein